MEEEKGEKKKARFTLDSSSEDNFGEEGVNEGDVVSSENKEDEEMKTMKEEIRKKEDEKKKLMEQRKEFLQKKIDQFNEKAAELKAKSFKKGMTI